jgi:hypothetical protein
VGTSSAIRSNWRAERGRVPFTGHGGRVRTGSQVRALSLPEDETREGSSVPADQRGHAKDAPRCAGVPDGETVLLARLCEGQHATVLQFPASPRAVNVEEGQKRDSLVR